MESWLGDIARRLGPVRAILVAVLAVILGVLVIVRPAVLGWFAGIALCLFGIGVLASLWARDGGRF